VAEVVVTAECEVLVVASPDRRAAPAINSGTTQGVPHG
jgi:hypothetical protein